MFSSRSVWFLLPLLLASSVGYGANVQVKWTGAKSALWNDSENWENGVKPGTGDYVTLSARADQPVLTNDIESLSVKQLKFVGDYPVTIAGNAITITRYETWDSACVVTSTVPISLDCGNDGPMMTLAKPIVFMEKVYSKKGINFNGASKSHVTFLNDVQVEGDILKGNNNFSLYFYGVADLYGFIAGSGCDFSVWFYAEGNEIGDAKQSYYGGTYACVKNAFPTNMVMRWLENNTADENDQRNMYYLFADQTIDRIESVAPTGTVGARKNVTHVRTGSAAVRLTLRGTANADTYTELMDKISLVWDPVGDYTQTFHGMAHRMTGTIAVMGGTLALADSCSFPNVTGLTVADGAVLSVDATSTTPFSDNAVRVEIGRTGRLALASGVRMAPTLVVVNGVCMPEGTYVGTGYGTDGVTEVDWISGAGQVTVPDPGVICWKSAVDGAWDTGANWTVGRAPTTGDRVSVMAGGADYTVSAGSACQMPSELEVGSADGHSVRLSVSADMSFVNTMLTLRDGGNLDVVAGRPLIDWTKLDFSGESALTLKDAAVWSQNNAVDEGAIRIGGRSGLQRVNFFNHATQTDGTQWTFLTIVGYDTGAAELSISNCFYDTQARGIAIGSPRQKGGLGATTGVKGVVNVLDGGTLQSEGQGAYSDGWGNSFIKGIVMGYGAYTSATTGRPYVGELNVRAGGVVKSLEGDVAMGIGRGEGRLLVDGGTVSVNDVKSGTYAFVRTFAIGLGGGKGGCTVRNGGSLTVACPGFIGGADKARFPLVVAAGLGTIWGYLDSGSEGELRVEDGDVVFRRGLTFGYDGSAKLAVIGSQGTFVADSVDVENGGSVEFGFELDANGVKPVQVTNGLALGENASLTVDMSRYEGSRSKIPLFKCGEISGTFAKTRLVGAPEGWEIVCDDDGVSVRKPTGMILILR